MTTTAHKTPTKVEVKFAPEALEKLAADLKTGRDKRKRVTVTDKMQPGLRAIVRNTGLISFHVNYDIDGTRPYLKLGAHPNMSISDARHLAKTVRSLAGMGIDVEAGLHNRLVRELKRDGTKWRP